MSEETTTIISSVLSLIAAVIAAYSAYKSNKVATQVSSEILEVDMDYISV